MFHIVESCPLTELNGGLSRLHSADKDAVSWMTNYGSRHAYEKKKIASTVQYIESIITRHTEYGKVYRLLCIYYPAKATLVCVSSDIKSAVTVSFCPEQMSW